jgi:DnaK suppressor protein
MADEMTVTTSKEKHDRVRRLLNAELKGISVRLHRDAEASIADVNGGNFLDVAQGLERQEQETLIASRLMEQARRLRVALARVNEGEYGLCSECGALIPAKRLVAVPDATTCVACQDRLEHTGAAARARANGDVDGDDA